MVHSRHTLIYLNNMCNFEKMNKGHVYSVLINVKAKNNTTQRSGASILPFPGGTGILAWTCEAFSWGGEGGVCMSGKAQGKHGETPFKYKKSAFDLHHNMRISTKFHELHLVLWELTWHLQTISNKIMKICNFSTFLGSNFNQTLSSNM